MRQSRRRPMPPPVAIVVPARNEADNIAQSVTSLLRQDYPAFSLVLVDDDSDDGTADVARRAAAALGAEQTAHHRAQATRCRRAGPASSGP